MPKIRDLGINAIPSILRDDTGTCDNESCDPSGQCVPSCDGASRAPQHGGFTHDAVAQLRSQLRDRLTK